MRPVVVDHGVLRCGAPAVAPAAVLAEKALERRTEFGDRSPRLSIVLVGVPDDADHSAVLEGVVQQKVFRGRVDRSALCLIGVERVADRDRAVGLIDVVVARRSDESAIGVVNDVIGDA